MVKIHITYPNGDEDLMTMRDDTFALAYEAEANHYFYSNYFEPVPLNQVVSYIKASPFAIEDD